MKAVRIEQNGGHDVVQVVDIPKPEAEDGKILVRVRNAGINPADMDVVMGLLPFAKEPPLTLGLEAAGVVEVGNDDLPKGTPVLVYGGLMGIVQDGVWQEYVSVPPEFCLPIPRGMTLAEAAVIPLVYLTAQASLIEGEFTAGSSVLVTGAGGGVGHAAYQLALLQGASIIIATVGSPEKKRRMHQYIDTLFSRPVVWSKVLNRVVTSDSLHERQAKFKEAVVDLSSENLEERVAEIVGDAGIDFTIDILGGDYLPRLINLAAPRGSVMVVGYKAGLESTLNLMPMLANQLRMWGTNVFNLKPEIQQASIDKIFDMVTTHNMRPVIAKRYKVDDVQEALEFMSTQRPFGKVVLNFD